LFTDQIAAQNVEWADRHEFASIFAGYAKYSPKIEHYFKFAQLQAVIGLERRCGIR
jgi:hypothetical protein